MARAHGWGVETDIRRAPDGGFYISHGRRATADGAEAGEVFAVFRAHPRATIALNVSSRSAKCCGWWRPDVES